MVKRIELILFLWCGIISLLYAENGVKRYIDAQTVQRAYESLSARYGENELMRRGVEKLAGIWWKEDGSAEDFIRFCRENYVADDAAREELMERTNRNTEAVTVGLAEIRKNFKAHNAMVLPVDSRFERIRLDVGMRDQLYRTKIAHVLALNFPYYSLEEKLQQGEQWSRKQWAYARMGDRYVLRSPGRNARNETKKADAFRIPRNYVADYNIYMGKLRDRKGRQLFPDDMRLLAHWNLRDEIKANYNKGKTGLEKQRTVYEVMKRIVLQDIPVEVINSDKYVWNPYKNKIYQDGREVEAHPETGVRYQAILNNYINGLYLDTLSGKTAIERKFSDDNEIPVEVTIQLFDTFLKSPEIKAVGKLIRKRLGRKTEGFDIWYDGFKSRASLDVDKLDAMTRQLYPDAATMTEKLPDLLMRLGYSAERAAYIASKIEVQAVAGSGHAAGAYYKGGKSYLCTRIAKEGMDYKGYNIAVHEFGHNVEQTVSLYDMDYYTLRGVPNTAFTEALAFVFQKRDLFLLGMENENPDKKYLDVLDEVWNLYEITGVAMTDLRMWQWMYAHPEAGALELKEAVVRIAKEVWNEYYADVLGVRDQTVLAVYTHMINYPLYLSSYAYGHIIAFQLEKYLEGKDFAREIDRIYTLGCLCPDIWMKQAVGESVSVEPLLEMTREALKRIK